MTRLIGVLLMCSALLNSSRTRADAPPPGYDKVRIELVPATIGGSTDEKDQISFTVTVIDGTNFKSFPQTYIDFNFDGSNGAPVMIRAPVCTWPLFQVTVQNKSDQILKLRAAGPGGDEVVIVVEDEQGNTIDAVRKKALLSQVDGNPRTAKQHAANPQQAMAQMKEQHLEMINRLPMLTDDASILPGRKANFITCFNYVPGATRMEEVDSWFQSRNAVTLGFFDVPVSRDAGGGIKKKTSYQVKFLVKVWKDRYEYDLRKETSSWTPVVKDSAVVRDAVPAAKESAATVGSPVQNPSPPPK